MNEGLSERAATKLTREEFFQMFPELKDAHGEDRVDERMTLVNNMRGAYMIDQNGTLPMPFHKAKVHEQAIEGSGRTVYLTDARGWVMEAAAPYESRTLCSGCMCKTPATIEDFIARMSERPAFAVAIDYSYVSQVNAGRLRKRVESEAVVYKLR